MASRGEYYTDSRSFYLMCAAAQISDDFSVESVGDKTRAQCFAIARCARGGIFFWPGRRRLAPPCQPLPPSTHDERVLAFPWQSHYSGAALVRLKVFADICRAARSQRAYYVLGVRSPEKVNRLLLCKCTSTITVTT